jgi:hypothetical protein
MVHDEIFSRWRLLIIWGVGGDGRKQEMGMRVDERGSCNESLGSDGGTNETEEKIEREMES